MDRAIIEAQISRIARGEVERGSVPLSRGEATEDERRALGELLAQRRRKGTKGGSHNYVLCPPGADYVVRVGKREELAAEHAEEMRHAVAAFDAGVGLPVLWCGLMEIDGAVVCVSCWPECACAVAYAKGLADGEHAKFGARLVESLARLASCLLSLDAASLKNALVDRETAAIVFIDFDPYFTRRVVTDEQRAASVGFVPVTALLLECSCASGMVSLAQIAQLAGCEPDLDAVASALGARCDAACRSFGGIAPVMMRIVQTYGVHGAGARAGKVARINAILDDVADYVPFSRVDRAGNTGRYLRTLLRVALSAAFDEQASFELRLDRFLVEHDGYRHFFPRAAKKQRT
jgi:hypothetical protein